MCCCVCGLLSASASLSLPHECTFEPKMCKWCNFYPRRGFTSTHTQKTLLLANIKAQRNDPHTHTQRCALFSSETKKKKAHCNSAFLLCAPMHKCVNVCVCVWRYFATSSPPPRGQRQVQKCKMNNLINLYITT